MTLDFICRNGSSKLLLIFAGWAMDRRPFASLRCDGYDIAVVFDYRDYGMAPLSGYDEICLIAWSFGVPAASDYINANPQLPLTLRLAVNGTLTPVDDLTGIPRAIFDGTLAGMTDRSLRKFYRRMCGSAEAFAEFSASMPQRHIDELAAELRAIDSRKSDRRRAECFDRVVIADTDAIIPTANQRQAWAAHPAVDIIEGSHLIDFQRLIDRYLTDKALVGDKFSRSMSTYDSEAATQQLMAARLASFLPPAAGADILEAGTGTGCFTRKAMERVGASNRWTLWDLAHIDTSLPGNHRLCDAEQAIRAVADASFDMILSAATIQWFNSPARFIAEAYRALRPGGIIAVSTFGERNFRELAPAIGQPRYFSASQWDATLRSLGIEAEIHESTIVREFTDSAALLRHISRTGVNALTSSASAGHRAARGILASGIRTLTYHPIYIIVRRKQP